MTRILELLGGPLDSGVLGMPALVREPWFGGAGGREADHYELATWVKCATRGCSSWERESLVHRESMTGGGGLPS